MDYQSNFFSIIRLNLVAFAAFFAFSVRAQTIEVGGGISGSWYMGDIDVYHGNVLPQMRGAASITGIYNFKDYLGFRANLTIGQLFADERRFPSSDYRKWRGFGFKSNFAELAALGEWSPVLARFGAFSGYLVGGLAATYVEATPDFSNNLELGGVAEDLNQRRSHVTVAVPVGGGVKWTFGDGWALRGEMMARKTFSDYFDGISKAASAKSKDFYFTSGILLTRSFGGGGRRNFASDQRRGSCPSF